MLFFLKKKIALLFDLPLYIFCGLIGF